MASCPSTAHAVLSVVDPDGALLRCGLLSGHHGPHRFEITWTDPDPRQAVSDEIARHLRSRRQDPDFRDRIQHRIVKDGQILDRLRDQGD